MNSSLLPTFYNGSSWTTYSSNVKHKHWFSRISVSYLMAALVMVIVIGVFLLLSFRTSTWLIEERHVLVESDRLLMKVMNTLTKKTLMNDHVIHQSQEKQHNLVDEMKHVDNLTMKEIHKENPKHSNRHGSTTVPPPFIQPGVEEWELLWRGDAATLRRPFSAYNRALKADMVRQSFQHAWRGYSYYAFGHDEIRPVTNRTNDSWNGWGVSLIDGLDTMLLMMSGGTADDCGFKDDYIRARDHVMSMRYNNLDRDISFFETTIRYLGGLLGAYTLSSSVSDRALYLERARELGDLLLVSFHPSTGIPYHAVNLATGTRTNPSWTGGASLLAEIGSFQLEFAYLSVITRNNSYALIAERATLAVESATNPIGQNLGLFPKLFHPENLFFLNSDVALGALSDSFYEYRLKQWVQFPYSKHASTFRARYESTLKGIRSLLLFRSCNRGLLYVSEMSDGAPTHRMDHLACFIPGLIALGARPGIDGISDRDLARDLARTCYILYEDMASGLGPESVLFNPSSASGRCPNDVDYTVASPKYILRPETIESLFILHRVTGDEIYLKWGWKIYEAIERHCRTGSAFSGILDVREANPAHDDSMQSFFLAETFKYLYLLLHPGELLPLSQFVFTTEAHPLPVMPTIKDQFAPSGGLQNSRGPPYPL